MGSELQCSQCMHTQGQCRATSAHALHAASKSAACRGPAAVLNEHWGQGAEQHDILLHYASIRSIEHLMYTILCSRLHSSISMRETISLRAWVSCPASTCAHIAAQVSADCSVLRLDTHSLWLLPAPPQSCLSSLEGSPANDFLPSACRWAAVPDEDWPQDSAQCDIILADFDQSSAMGDRRQEIVFIGAGMDEAAIAAQLDSALLTKDEMTKYLEHHKTLVRC